MGVLPQTVVTQKFPSDKITSQLIFFQSPASCQGRSGNSIQRISLFLGQCRHLQKQFKRCGARRIDHSPGYDRAHFFLIGRNVQACSGELLPIAGFI